MANDDPLLPAERGELLIQHVEPPTQLWRVGLGECRVADLVAALDQVGREQELPVLGRPVVLYAVQDQKASCHNGKHNRFSSPTEFDWLAAHTCMSGPQRDPRRG